MTFFVFHRLVGIDDDAVNCRRVIICCYRLQNESRAPTFSPHILNKIS